MIQAWRYIFQGITGECGHQDVHNTPHVIARGKKGAPLVSNHCKTNWLLTATLQTRRTQELPLLLEGGRGYRVRILTTGALNSMEFFSVFYGPINADGAVT